MVELANIWSTTIEAGGSVIFPTGPDAYTQEQVDEPL